MGDSEVQAKGDSKPVNLSEPDMYGDQPPRLIAALDDAPTDDHADVAEVVHEKYSEALAQSAKKKKAMGLKKEPKVGDKQADAQVPVASYLTKESGEKDKKGNPIRPAPTTAEALKAILPKVIARLGQDLSACWKTQDGPIAKWSSGGEEKWAQIVNELLFGITYGGPAEGYAMGTPYGQGEGAGKAESWLGFIYRRCEAKPVRVKKAWRKLSGSTKGPGHVVYGAFEVVSFEDLHYPGYGSIETITMPPKTEGTTYQQPILPDDLVDAHYELEAENVDPAVPVVAACQHTATLIALLRGYPFDWIGDYENPCAGFQASEANRGAAIFGSQGPRKEDGTAAPPPAGPAQIWSPGGHKLVTPPSGGQWIEPTPDLLEDVAKTVKEHKLGPATIFVWDPDFKMPKDLTIKMSPFEATPEMFRSVCSEFFKTRGTVGAGNFADWPDVAPDRSERATKIRDNLKKEFDALKVTVSLPKPPKSAADRYKVVKAALGLDDAGNKVGTDPVDLEKDRKRSKEMPYKGGHQLPGSHINAILRVHKDHEAFQVFDTGIGAHLGILAATGSEAILPFGGSTVADGYRHPTAGAVKADGSATSHEASGVQVGEGAGKTFAGIGIPPPCPRSFDEQAALLAKARSIGLVRLALTRRSGPFYDKNNVLFMSQLRTMYDADKNYPISKLLWALRNSPGFTQIQPWFLIYAPKGMLARAMYARGSRGKSVADFVELYKKPFVDLLEAHKDDKAGIPWSEVEPHSEMLRWFQKYGSDSWPPTDPKSIKTKIADAAAGKLYAPRHYTLFVVVTNHGSDIPAYAGKSQLYTRFKYSEGSSQLVGDGGPLGLGGLKVHESLSWDETWPKTLPQEVADAVPDFFKAAPLQIAAPPAEKKAS